MEQVIASLQCPNNIFPNKMIILHKVGTNDKSQVHGESKTELHLRKLGLHVLDIDSIVLPLTR